MTKVNGIGSLLVGDEDFERAHEMSEWDALVALPLLGLCEIINEDDEILILALVVGLDLLCFSASHVDVCLWVFVLSCVVVRIAGKCGMRGCLLGVCSGV